MKPFACLVCAAALSVVGPSYSATSAGPGHAFVFSLSLDRTLKVGGEAPQNLTLQKGATYRVRVETRSDDTAQATFSDITGRLVGFASGVVEHRTPENHVDIPSGSHSKLPWTLHWRLQELDGKMWLAIGGLEQRQVLIRLYPYRPGPEWAPFPESPDPLGRPTGP
jgi:hypothetical protein